MSSKRPWLEKEIQENYLPAIRTWKDDRAGRLKAKRLASDLRSAWSQRGLETVDQQYNLMTDVRRAIKDEFGEDHFSLQFIAFTSEEYTERNNRSQARIADRNEDVKQIDKPDEIVAQAVQLLESREWSEIAAGLSVLTGRRLAELVATANFEPKSRWSVLFSGAVKRRDEEFPLQFEIPTLTTASRVCEALSRLRKELPETVGLAPTAINQGYSAAVAKACDKYFANLIPLRSGRDNLYTHISRSIYSIIASFWYCPPQVNEVEFRAAIQGHYAILDEKNPEKRRSLVASRHYSDYEIADSVIARYNGKRKGIKLGFGGIQVIDAFKQVAEDKGVAVVENTGRKTQSSVRLWKEDRAKLDKIFEEMGLGENSNQLEKMNYLISWIEKQLGKKTAETSLPTIVSEPEMIIESPPQSEEVASVPTKADATSLDKKFEQLMDVMKLFVEGQMTTTQPITTPSPLPAAARTQQKTTTAPSSSPAPVSQEPKRGEVSDEKLQQAMKKIMEYNDAPERLHDEKWAITLRVLKAFVKSQPRLQQFIINHQAELDEHYKKHGIDPLKQNYKHRGKDISQIINFDEL
jgi:hypothetical protein